MREEDTWVKSPIPLSNKGYSISKDLGHGRILGDDLSDEGHDNSKGLRVLVEEVNDNMQLHDY